MSPNPFFYSKRLNSLDDPKMDKFLHYVLHGRTNSTDADMSIYTLQNFGQHISDEFNNTSQFSTLAQSKDVYGKLGKNNVVLDASTNVGIFMVEEDRLGVSSQANFSTVRANCCVFKGKWIYEVMLSSKGVMQLGWSTKYCHFSHEQGVGDTPDSYSYDGNRIRKWNVATAKYGEPWRIGDTIGCAIDLDNGTISFYRNGINMGEAFSNIKMGHGIAYFPTISLSINESVRLNFGATPLLHPVEGFSPLQDPPTQDLIKAKIIFKCLGRIIDVFIRTSQARKKQIQGGTKGSDVNSMVLPKFDFAGSKDPGTHSKMEVDDQPDTASPSSSNDNSKMEMPPADYELSDLPAVDGMSYHALLFIIAGLFYEKLNKILNNPYIVETCLFKFVIKHISATENCDVKWYERSMVSVLMDLFWSFVDDNQTKSIMEHLVTSILIHYRFSPLEKDFRCQKLYLSAMLEILRHEPTRKFLLQHILFEKVKFPLLMHIKSPDFKLLESFIPEPWIDTSVLIPPTANRINPPFDYSVARIMDASVAAQHAQVATIGIPRRSNATSISSTSNSLGSLSHYSDPSNYSYSDLRGGTGLPGSSSASINTSSMSISDLGASDSTSSSIPSSEESSSTINSPRMSPLRAMEEDGADSRAFRTTLTSLGSNFSHGTAPDSLISVASGSQAFSTEGRNDSNTSNLNNLTSSLYFGAGSGYNLKGDGNATSSSVCQDYADKALEIFTNSDAKEKYQRSLSVLEKKVAELENLQQQIVRVLLNNKDSVRGFSSRYIFLKKFRDFIRQNLSVNLVQTPNKCPHPAILCMFHRLAHELRSEWDSYAQRYPYRAVPSDEAFVPCQFFFNDSINYFDLQRIAGIMSYLKKTYDSELSAELDFLNGPLSPNPSSSITNRNPSTSSKNLKSSSSSVQAYTSSLTIKQSTSESFALNPKTKLEGSSASLIELLDGIILLYHISGHKHTSKMAKVREILREYISSIKSLQSKINDCPEDRSEFKAELERTKQVFTVNAMEQARHLTWIKTIVFSKSNQENVHWLLQTILRTINKAVDKGGSLYLFVPEFYFETCLNAFYDLKSNFNPTAPLSDLVDFSSTLRRYVRFVTRFFRDTSIVSSELRDAIVQSLANLVCYPDSLAVLETGLDLDSRHDLVSKLLAPYENRPWAQTNWILVRFWKGCGFGFGYVHPPHLKRNDSFLRNNGLNPLPTGPAVDFVKPMPSPIYQTHIGEVLSQDQEKATATVNSILNQLNWAFSEFVGMLQEIQQASSRPDVQVFIDSRQLKLCATCFDLTVGLLRCLEMIAKVTPGIFVDFSRSSAEILLTNLFQLTCQILARVTSRKSAFNMVVSMAMPGLEMMHHYPILSAVAGILVQLTMRNDEKDRQQAITILLREPGFQISALKCLINEEADDGSKATTSDSPEIESEADKLVSKQFCFRNYEEVNRSELEEFERMVEVLEIEQGKENKSMACINEDNMCPICYARPLEVQFEPCGHKSCRACITHYLMNKRECFFCKSNVGSISDIPVDSIGE